MTQGIRAFVNGVFDKSLPELPSLGNTKFRASVMQAAVIAYGISVASAATHYNHALKLAKANTPDLVATLGRAEDKKGGRKAKVVVIDAPAAVAEATVVELVDVVKVKTGEVVASGLTKANAEALCAKAIAAKKAKLAIQVTAPAVEATVAVVEAAPEAVTA